MKFKTILPIIALTIIGVSSLSARYRTTECGECCDSETRTNNRSNRTQKSYQGNGSTLRSYDGNMQENVDTAYNNPFSSQKYNSGRAPRTGYNSGFNNYNKSAYDADYSSGY